jgi:hypothetical protein
MTTFELAIDGLLQLLRQFMASVAVILGQIEHLLRSQLQQLGMPETIQTLILLALVTIVALWSIRLFGGVFRIGVLGIVLLIVIHAMMFGLPA